MNNELTDYESMVNEYKANEFTVTEPTVLEKRLLIIDDYSSHSSVELFQFPRNPNIGFVYLLQHTTHLLQVLNVGIFDTLVYAYCLKQDE